MKTRLATTIGAQAAREIYRDLAAGVWAGLRADGLQRRLWGDPPEALDALAGWLPDADALLAQPATGLGGRLCTAFDEAFAAGTPWAAAVGTDAPAVDAPRVLQAGSALSDADVALVPAEDGGYAVLALARPQPALFEDIPWSGPDVLAATLARARAAGLRTAVLEPVRDLDTVEDLRALRAAGLLPS